MCVCACLSVPRLWFVPFMLWLGEVIINAKATLAFQMLFFFLFKRNKQTSDNHLSSVGSRWIQIGRTLFRVHWNIRYPPSRTLPLMLLSLLVWMTEFLDQSLPRVFNNKLQNLEKNAASSHILSTSVAANNTKLHEDYVLLNVLVLYTLWAFIQPVPVSYHQAISLSLPPHPSDSTQHINLSLFLINLLHTDILIPLNKMHHRWIIKKSVASVFSAFFFFIGAAHWGICIPGNIFLVEVDVVAGGFIWWQTIPNARANTKETGLMVRLGCLLLIKTNWHNIYLQAAPKLWTINIHFPVA